MHSIIFGILRLWVVLGVLAAPVSAQSTDPDLQTRAEAALVDGRADEALGLTEDILRTAPNSFAALFVKAAALIDLDQPVAGAQAAEAAYNAARDGNERLIAARLASRGRRLAGHYVRAEWWARRAANAATTPEDARNVALDIQAIRRANPWSVDLSFGIAPSNNINDGSDDGYIVFEGLGRFELPPDQLPLSGIEYTANLRAERRLSFGPTHTTRAGVYLYGRTYTPSSSAKDTVPGIRGSDYALVLGEVYVSHGRLLFPRLGASEVTVHIGHLNYAREPYWDYQKLTLAQNFALSDGRVLTARTSREWQSGIDRRHEATRILNAELSLRGTRGNRDSYQLSVSAKDYDTDAFEASYREYRLQIGYRFAKPVKGVKVGGALSVGHLNYPAFFASLDGRRDTYVTASANATWTNVSYFGFSPRLDLIAETRNSDVNQYSSNSLSLRLGVESTF